ncbi:MAG: hypothetical protein JOZ95_13165 [Solirubrobacterales bacterium]|nr:hypothetical protein [Solirubrobacterales bacterium]
MAESTARRALALGLLMSGRGAEAIAELEFVSVSKIEPVWFEAELLVLRGVLEGWRGELRSAAKDLSTAIRWSRAGVTLGGLPNAYSELAEVEHRLGRWGDRVPATQRVRQLNISSRRKLPSRLAAAAAGTLSRPRSPAVQGHFLG